MLRLAYGAEGRLAYALAGDADALTGSAADVRRYADRTRADEHGDGRVLHLISADAARIPCAA